MCGIHGFNFRDEKLIDRMVDSTAYRGPDGRGVFCDDRISIGHNLLAITESPEQATQPVKSPAGDHAMVYNGEVYNYVDLREDLRRRGRRFSTDGDTEVLFAGLEMEGESFLRKVNGMFSIAYYDKPGGRLILSRDPAGMRPLYYYRSAGKFIFSSEIRGILRHPVPARLDMEALDIFLDIGYVPGPRTLIEGIFKVCPGEIIEVSLADGQVKSRWMDFSEDHADSRPFDPHELRGLISAAVSRHLMGRRSVGLYLSGGLDSTVLLYEIARLKKTEVRTYSTRFEGAESYFNEDSDAARRLAGEYGIRHTEILVTESDYARAIDDVVDAVEEPRHNNSLAAYYLLAEAAARDVVVTLSGEGGDELFGGYPKYLESRKLGHAAQPIGRWLDFARFGFDVDRRFFRFQRAETRLRDYLQSWSGAFIDGLSSDTENALMAIDRRFWLSDEAFLRSDKIGMHFGMESRFPFADRTLSAWADRTPSGDKLNSNGHALKTPLRAVYSGILPDYVIQKRKTGWKAPVGMWMSSRLAERFRETLSENYCAETSGLFDFEGILKTGKDDPAVLASRKIFPIFSFQVWARRFHVRL
ncbi:asparagine synthase (glutamine-hydrolyzing) [bacterium]|nr:asparagine synthase (glutamine-hydrolyzing) [bacterium]